MAARDGAVPVPDVTVVIAAYNAMPYLIRCLTSALNQSLGLDRIEVIAVDDGSTDGSGEQLDQFAAAYPALRVIHQKNSGGPAGPRNVGIEHAGGRYLFFLDADDYLGREALERMVAMGDANGSDVVLGRMVAVGDREVPTSMFRHNQPRADLFTSRVYRTLRCQRLFRRSMVEQAGIRFPDLLVGQDQIFAALAYFHASVISVVADYDCYYLVQREDGQNITTLVTDVRVRLGEIEYLMALVDRHIGAGPRRDFLMRRHFGTDLTNTCLSGNFLTNPRSTQVEVLSRVRTLIDRWYTPGVAEGVPARTRLRMELIRQGRLDELIELVRVDVAGGRQQDIVDRGRVYGGYPYFRDPQVGIADTCFEVTAELAIQHHLTAADWHGGVLRLTGHAFISHVDTVDPGTELVLRERRTGAEHRWPTHATPTPHLTTQYGADRYDYGMAGFTAEIDLAAAADGAPLPAGLWDAFLMVRAQGVAREVRLGSKRARAIDPARRTRVVAAASGGVVVTSYHTRYGNLTLDVGETAHQLTPDLVVDRVTWHPLAPATLVITGRVELGRAGELPDPRLRVLLTAPGAGSYRIAADLDVGPGRRGFVAMVPLARAAGGRPLRCGHWDIALELDVAGVARAVPVPAPQRLPARRWWRRGRPVLVTATHRRGTAALTLSRRPRPRLWPDRTDQTRR